MPRSPLIRLLGLGVVLTLYGTPAPAKRDPQLKDWPAGPIRYIAQKVELQTFKDLRDDRERSLFIERFWARRDPSPETLANEYRQLFWERVNEANASFLDSSRDGWRTDRGKIHILYGAPTTIEEDLHLDTGGRPTAGHGLIRWLYEGRPEQRMDLNPVTVVAFTRDSGGEYRISYDPELTSVFFDALAIEERTDRGVDSLFDQLGSGLRSELAVMLDLGRMQEVPPQSRVLLERVETAEAYGSDPITVMTHRYYDPDRAGTIAVVTVDVTHVDPSISPAIIARFADPGNLEAKPRMLGEDSFKIAELVDGRRIAQSRAPLDAGSYQLTVMLVDMSSGITGLDRSAVVVREPDDRLRFSDVTWADALEPLRYASLASHSEAFHVGPYRVLPHVGDRFRRGETLRLFYEVYGGAAPYAITYQLEGRDVDGSWVRLGQPSSGREAGSAQGWELATSESWPEGEYQIRIEVTDAADRLIVTQVPFMLEIEETPDSTH